MGGDSEWAAGCSPFSCTWRPIRRWPAGRRRAAAAEPCRALEAPRRRPRAGGAALRCSPRRWLASSSSSSVSSNRTTRTPTSDSPVRRSSSRKKCWRTFRTSLSECVHICPMRLRVAALPPGNAVLLGGDDLRFAQPLTSHGIVNFRLSRSSKSVMEASRGCPTRPGRRASPW